MVVDVVEYYSEAEPEAVLEDGLSVRDQSNSEPQMPKYLYQLS